MSGKPAARALDDFSFDQHVEYFFLPPCEVEALPDPLKVWKYRPVLHLLRRDLQQLYGAEDVLAGKMATPFIALSSMMTGFDILSALFAAEEQDAELIRAAEILKPHGLESKLVSGIGAKFRKFLTDCAALSEEDADFIWCIRCSVIHTYSLKLAKNKFRFVSVSTDAMGAPVCRLQLVAPQEGTLHMLSLWDLKKTFLKAIFTFKTKLENAKDSPLGSRFLAGVKKSGYIQIS